MAKWPATFSQCSTSVRPWRTGDSFRFRVFARAIAGCGPGRWCCAAWRSNDFGNDFLSSQLFPSSYSHKLSPDFWILWRTCILEIGISALAAHRSLVRVGVELFILTKECGTVFRNRTCLRADLSSKAGITQSLGMGGGGLSGLSPLSL